MSKLFWIGAAAAAAVVAPLAANVPVGGTATNFSLRDVDGNVVKLSDYKGKIVVLEWHNYGCPYVKKHYGSGNMQKTQAAATGQGVVWLTINSSAEGQQGHMKGPEAKTFVSANGLKSTEYLLDPEGLVGKGYGAKTTPHMYVIDASGKLVYNGAIDDKPTNNPADIAGARNHVLEALAEVKAGKSVSVAETKPYGCSVKYKA